MGQQHTFAGVAYTSKKKQTKRERFLQEMDAVIPWSDLLALIAPHYPKAGRGRQPLPMEVLLRVYFLQQWFNLSDPLAEEMLYDSESMRRFARVELGEDTVPDESTILRFRHLLEKHQLTAQMFAAVKERLAAKRLLLSAGTIVDATIIAAPSSTKNAMHTRDAEMRQTKKGNMWHFGMKIHVGTDRRGTVHSVTVTDAAVADVTQFYDLLHGGESVVYGDKAYDAKAHREDCEAQGVKFRVNRRGLRTPYRDRINRARSRVRAHVEHPFQVIKRLWGFTKVRYRGLAKNATRVFAALMLSNLYLLRRRLVAA
jgi:IS5 family transposase